MHYIHITLGQHIGPLGSDIKGAQKKIQQKNFQGCVNRLLKILPNNQMHRYYHQMLCYFSACNIKSNLNPSLFTIRAQLQIKQINQTEVKLIKIF